MPVDPAPVDPAAADPAIAAALLAWYDRHARILPWRIGPHDPAAPDPYRIWLSEVMLQQTNVTAAKPYFLRFTARWPDVAALAVADDADLMAAWAGLGYYARARNLLACARTVMRDHGGRFPETEAALLRLPGIGRYTAAAIAAIAFGRRAVVVDGNVERVTARLFAIAEPLPAARERLRALADTITPDARAGDFAQAMMDLGATICTPRSPRCLLCPVAEDCRARAEGSPAAYPVRAVKRAMPLRRGIAWWMERDGRVLLVRRPPTGLLGGMRALPGGEWTQAPDETPPLAAAWRSLGSVTHVFTHFSLVLDVRGACVGAADIAGDWWPIDRLGDAGLPTLYARATALGVGVFHGQEISA